MKKRATLLRIENDRPITYETDREFLFTFQCGILLALKEKGMLTDEQYREAENRLRKHVYRRKKEDSS